jgi:hypothetical protein
VQKADAGHVAEAPLDRTHERTEPHALTDIGPRRNEVDADRAGGEGEQD